LPIDARLMIVPQDGRAAQSQCGGPRLAVDLGGRGPTAESAVRLIHFQESIVRPGHHFLQVPEITTRSPIVHVDGPTGCVAIRYAAPSKNG
jgi:hypothetical protein